MNGDANILQIFMLRVTLNSISRKWGGMVGNKLYFKGGQVKNNRFFRLRMGSVAIVIFKVHYADTPASQNVHLHKLIFLFEVLKTK